MDFSTKSVFSKFAQLNLAAEGQACGAVGMGAERVNRLWGNGVSPTQELQHRGDEVPLPGLRPLPQAPTGKRMFGDLWTLGGVDPKNKASPWHPLCVIHTTSLPPDPRLFAPSIKARFPPETYALVGQQVTLECFAFGK